TPPCPARQQGSSSLFPRGSAYLEAFAEEARPVEVPVTTLDAFLGPDSAPVDLLKIDAEGAEPLIFDGMRGLLERTPHLRVVIEFTPPVDRERRPRRGCILGHRLLARLPHRRDRRARRSSHRDARPAPRRGIERAAALALSGSGSPYGPDVEGRVLRRQGPRSILEGQHPSAGGHVRLRRRGPVVVTQRAEDGIDPTLRVLLEENRLQLGQGREPPVALSREA